jgi:hypothetical protein
MMFPKRSRVFVALIAFLDFFIVSAILKVNKDCGFLGLKVSLIMVINSSLIYNDA